MDDHMLMGIYADTLFTYDTRGRMLLTNEPPAAVMAWVSPTRHQVRIIVSHEQAMKAMAYARGHDVERGGQYDARSAAIHIWSHSWRTPELRQSSDLIGSIYLAWNSLHPYLVTKVELHVEAVFTLSDVEQHLELLFGGA
jgi:hypothetical protein